MKLIIHVNKEDDDSVLQLGSHIFTLQCVSSQFPSLAAQLPFQGLQHPEQLKDWSNRESIPPSLETLAQCSRHLVLSTSNPNPSTAGAV